MWLLLLWWWLLLWWLLWWWELRLSTSQARITLGRFIPTLFLFLIFLLLISFLELTCSLFGLMRFIFGVIIWCTVIETSTHFHHITMAVLLLEITSFTCWLLDLFNFADVTAFPGNLIMFFIITGGNMINCWVFTDIVMMINWWIIFVHLDTLFPVVNIVV